MEDKYKFIITLGKMLGLNVNTPKEVLDKVEGEMSKEEQDAWVNIQIAFSSLDKRSINPIIRLIVMKYIKTIEVLRLCNDIREDNCKVLLFLRDHREYQDEMMPPEELLNNLSNEDL